MKKIIALAVGIIFSVNGFSQAPNWLWAKKISGTSHDYGFSIAVDALGNVYTTGCFQGTVDFNPGAGVFNLTSAGSFDIFISKLDASGSFVWAKAMGGAIEDQGLSIVIDGSGNIFTTGRFGGTVDFDPGAGTFNLTSAGSHDIFVSKLDASGNFAWAKAMGGPTNDRGYSITIDKRGNIYTTGYFHTTADFDPGPGIFNLSAGVAADIFISKLDSSGNFIWAKAMGGASADDIAESIAVDGAGNVYTTGIFQYAADFDPGPGVYYLTAMGTNYADIFISKLDSSGNFVWANQRGGTGFDYSNSITLDASANIYFTGRFYETVDFHPGAGIFNLTSAGNSDIFICKLDSSGNFIWAKSIGGTFEDEGLSISLDQAGARDVYTTGYFRGTVDFNPGAGIFNLTSVGISDIFVSKLDSLGNFIWAKSVLGGINFDMGESIAPDAFGNVYLTGEFSNVSVFDADTLICASATVYDIFIAKLDTISIQATINEVENSENGFLVSPNPATNEIRIEGTTFKIESIEIYDVLGQRVYSEQPVTGNPQQVKVNVSVWNAGMYFVKVNGENKQAVVKLMKE